MPLYGRVIDSAFIRRVNRDLINRVMGEEVGYYKLSLADTQIDIYGESSSKMYFNPVLLTCIVGRNPQQNNQTSYGSDTDRLMSFSFLKADLIPIGLVPEKGDIIMWNESYFEVDIPIEDQLVVGKDPNYALEDSNKYYGMSLSITCESHLTHINRLNIIQSR